MIEDAIRQAQAMHRAAVEAAYGGECRIYEQRPMKDPVTKVMKQEEVLAGKKIPCHLSFSGSNPGVISGMVMTANQTIKLFLAPEIEVKPGSRIEVTQNGQTECYARSGQAAVYDSHQEVSLELFRGYV